MNTPYEDRSANLSPGLTAVADRFAAAIADIALKRVYDHFAIHRSHRVKRGNRVMAGPSQALTFALPPDDQVNASASGLDLPGGRKRPQPVECDRIANTVGVHWVNLRPAQTRCSSANCSKTRSLQKRLEWRR